MYCKKQTYDCKCMYCEGRRDAESRDDEMEIRREQYHADYDDSGRAESDHWESMTSLPCEKGLR